MIDNILKEMIYSIATPDNASNIINVIIATEKMGHDILQDRLMEAMMSKVDTDISLEEINDIINTAGNELAVEMGYILVERAEDKYIINRKVITGLSMLDSLDVETLRIISNLLINEELTNEEILSKVIAKSLNSESFSYIELHLDSVSNKLIEDLISKVNKLIEEQDIEELSNDALELHIEVLNDFKRIPELNDTVGVKLLATTNVTLIEEALPILGLYMSGIIGTEDELDSLKISDNIASILHVANDSTHNKAHWINEILPETILLDLDIETSSKVIREVNRLILRLDTKDE